MRYCLITPCRDEAAFAARTIASVEAQTARPDLWVLVDDGSSDGTTGMLAAAAARHPWIRVITRTNRGTRVLGSGVIEAFDTGLASIRLDDFDCVCKFDLDLVIPPDYFAGLIRHLEQEPRLGCCSGQPYFLTAEGRKVSERCGSENAVGMTKFYRTTCFQEIGGFARVLMWDAIDCHEARRRGWLCRAFPDPGLEFLHLRPMGTSDRGWWTGRSRHGRGQWILGTSPVYILASAVFRLLHPPAVLGSIAMLVGYGAAALRRTPRHGDAEFRRWVRRTQYLSLFLGKRRAFARIEAGAAAAWRH